MFHRIYMSLLDIIDTSYESSREKDIPKHILSSYVKFYKCRKKGMNIFLSLLLFIVHFVFIDFFYNFFINILFFSTIGCRSPFPLYTGSLDRKLTIFKKPRNKKVKGKEVKAFPDAKNVDRMMCDGEYLIIRNNASLDKMVFLLIAAITISVILYQIYFKSVPFFKLNGHLYVLLTIFAYMIGSIFPERRFVLFDRHREYVTFYRGLIRRPVTVRYKDVVFTHIENSARVGLSGVKVNYGNIKFHFHTLYSASSVGAIKLFMDNSTASTYPLPLHNSILYHRDFNETLWRFSWFKKPLEEEFKRYKAL